MAVTATIDDAQLESLERAIREHAESAPTGAARSELTAAGAQEAFCSSWPTAKAALQGLQTVLDLVPGVGVFAKAAIVAVVAAGDAAHRALCGGAPG